MIIKTKLFKICRSPKLVVEVYSFIGVDAAPTSQVFPVICILYSTDAAAYIPETLRANLAGTLELPAKSSMQVVSVTSKFSFPFRSARKNAKLCHRRSFRAMVKSLDPLAYSTQNNCQKDHQSSHLLEMSARLYGDLP